MPKQSKHAPVRTASTIRREAILKDRADGMTFATMAAKYGISVSRIRTIVAEEFHRLSEVRADLSEELVRKQLRRLDDLLEAVWDEAREGNIKAVAAALNVVDRQSRLLGLDAPAKIQGTLAYTDLSLDQLRAQARMMGILPADSGSGAPVALLEVRPEPTPIDAHDKESVQQPLD